LDLVRKKTEHASSIYIIILCHGRTQPTELDRPFNINTTLSELMRELMRELISIKEMADEALAMSNEQENLRSIQFRINGKIHEISSISLDMKCQAEIGNMR
jgi:hypothetical protein